MYGIYRDGLSEPRRRAEAAAEEALDRGEAIVDGQFCELPFGIQRELKALERQLSSRVQSLDSVAWLEQRTDEYLQVVAAAEAIVEALPLRFAMRRRRLLQAALAAVWLAICWVWMAGCSMFNSCGSPPNAPIANLAALYDASAPNCVFTQVEQCSQLCLDEGRCEVRDGDCVATTRTHCVSSEGCKSIGQCSLHRGRCVTSSDEDCALSRMCLVGGRCRAEQEELDFSGLGEGYHCVAKSNDDCVGSSGCRYNAECIASTGRCVTCPEAKACRTEGRCAMSEGRCVARSARGCRESEVCRWEERCTARDGRCVNAQE